MFGLLDIVLRRVVATGRLAVIDSRGRRHTYGDGSGKCVTMRLHNRWTEVRLALDPELALGETYMAGALTVEGGGIHDLLDLFQRNLGIAPLPLWGRVMLMIRRLGRNLSTRNSLSSARANVIHHYDIDDRIYDLFLDRARQYSCGYFPVPGLDLDSTQQAKLNHLAVKLDLEPGQRVLDIGSGWGGLACHLAAHHGANVCGVTLSPSQLAHAEARAREQGLADRVTFALQDYRETQGPFERIVSVGMLEHVGVPNYDAYFGQIARLLTGDGVALVHTIGRSDGPGVTSPFVSRYIFPGAYSPALSELLPAIERSGLIVTDIEVLRLHYAETLKAWRERFTARREEAARILGERFCRMWEFYLSGAEGGFRHQGLVVFQIQLARRVDTLPVTRDYMVDSERAAAAAAQRQEVAKRRWPLAGE